VTASLTLYRMGLGAIEPLAPMLLRRRARRGKEDPARLGERLGRASAARPDGPLIWLHGASIGETLSLLPLVEGLRRTRPRLALLVTSGTVTSAALLARRLPEGVIHQYVPVDAPASARRFLEHWRPNVAVLVESELWPNLLLGAQARRGRLEVSVADDGPGIPAADLPRLFDRFYQSRTSVAPAGGEGGRGLGLAIVKRIAELHGGEATVASTPGQGTRIVLSLPVVRDVAPAA